MRFWGGALLFPHLKPQTFCLIYARAEEGV
jgi:hypothetical protein